MDSELRKLIGLDDLRPVHLEIKIPIVDDEPSLTPWKPTAASERLFQRLELEHTVKAIFGDEAGREMLDMMKDPSGLVPSNARLNISSVDVTPLDNPCYENSSQATQTPNLPKPTDPRKKQCACSCTRCERGSCGECQADPRCEFAFLAPVGELLDIDSETGAELRQAAQNRQLSRLRKARVAKHRTGLKPTLAKFKSDLWPLSNHVDSMLFENLLDSMADFVADAVAAR